MSKKMATNSFEAREKKTKKVSAITKMSELMKETGNDVITSPLKEDIITTPKSPLISTEVEEELVIPSLDLSSHKSCEAEKHTLTLTNDFFNLNIKNQTFEGKVTTVRVYDDILDILKNYATIKNYPIIEFTNKVITLGLESIDNYGMVEISEIKFKNSTSRSIMYNLTDTMEITLNNYINEMSKKGYKISRNVILNVILNETLKKFHY